MDRRFGSEKGKINLPYEAPENRHVFHLYVIQAEKRDELIKKINLFGVMMAFIEEFLELIQR